MRALLILLAACAPLCARAVAPVDSVTEAAASAVLAALGRQGLTGVVQPRALVRTLDNAGGQFRVEPRPITADQLRHRMVVWVDLWAAERFVRSVPVAVNMELSGEAAPVQVQQDFARTVTRQPERVVDVHRGEWAALRTSAGAVSLESRVEVLQDGRAGDRIRVRQQGATGIVLARVVGRGQLELAP